MFIGGLAWATTTESLQKAFEEFGEIVDCVVITDKQTGRSKGFGFVTFSESDAASEAQDKMNGTDLDGRNIKVEHHQQGAKREGIFISFYFWFI